MIRSEVYAKVKEYGLQDSIKETYGFNFTNLSTATLVEFIENFEKSLIIETDCPAEEKVNALIEMLYKKHILCKSEYEALMA